MKRILFVANGESIHTAKWVDYFVERGYDVHLATFSRAHATACKNVHFLSGRGVNRRGGNFHYLLGVPKLAALIRALRPDAVNAHYSYSLGLVARLAIRRSGTAPFFSVVCHGSDVLAPPAPPVFDRLNRFVLRGADRCFSVSDQITDRLVSLGVPPEKIVTGQYGVEPPPEPEAKTVDFVSTRAWHPNSRIPLLLEALEAFPGRRSVFVLPGADDTVLASLRKRHPAVTFHGALPHAEVMQLLRRSRFYLSATRSDGTALSLLEAMACGCVPVVSNIVSNRSWVLDGVNGFLFRHGSQLREILERTAGTDDARLEKMRQVNRDIVRERADYRRRMAQTEAEIFAQEKK